MNGDKRARYARYFLQYGLAFVFLYVAISGFIAPENWIGFIPSWLTFSDPLTMLYGHLAFDALIGIWLALNWKPFWAASLGALNLLSIIVVNFGVFDIIFRDVGLLCAALALLFLTKR